jgi:hypothetical protein
MRRVLSTDEQSGTDRFQKDDEVNDELAHDVTFIELLGCKRSDYERQDVATPKPVPMATVAWFDARPMCDKLKDASDLAFLLEANRRGYAIAGNALTGRWPSGKKKHKSKKRGN